MEFCWYRKLHFTRNTFKEKLQKCRYLEFIKCFAHNSMFVFVNDKETIETTENFILEGKNSTQTFKHFISNMFKSIIDGSFTHEMLVESLWMKY